MGAWLRALAVPAVGLLLLVAFGAGAISQLDGLRAGRESMKARGEPLYLPSATVLRVATLGHRTTAADVLHLWAIQYFGNRVSRADRPWIARVYGLMTDLDPHFRDAYWLGFVSLLVEGRDPAAAFDLADKALREEPGFTLIAVEAALTARRLGDQERARHYLEAASHGTDDPLPRRLLLRLGATDTAQQELAEWTALLASDDELTRSIAESHVRDLTAHVDATRLEALVACFEQRTGRPPHELAELVRAGFLRALPTDPEGQEWVYDRRARTVQPVKAYRWVPPSRARLGVDLGDLGSCATARPASAAP